MRHQRDLFRSLAAVHRASRALRQPRPLPVRIRVLDLMTEIILAAGALRAGLEHEEAAAVREILPEIDRVIDAIEELMVRLAS